MKYKAHEKGVKSFSFSHDSLNFISCGYDKRLLLWDVETGGIANSYKIQKIPFCVKMTQNQLNPFTFLAGCENGNVLQFDT